MEIYGATIRFTVGEGLDPPGDFDNSKITIAEGNKIIFPYENPEIVNYFRWEGQDPPLQYEFVSLARETET